MEVTNRSYPWVGKFQRRCKARLDKKWYIYKGRCELVRNHDGAHALERGMEIVEFETTPTCYLTHFAAAFVEEEVRRRSEQTQART